MVGREYPRRVIVDLAGARESSLEAVLEVRRNNPDVILRSGHEKLILDNGNTAVLITRKDYKAGEVLTKQTAGEKWDPKKRINTRDPSQVAMQESISNYSNVSQDAEPEPVAKQRGGRPRMSAGEARNRRNLSKRRVQHLVRVQ